MNILEIIIIIVMLALILDGYRIGLIKTVFSIVKMIVGVMLAAVVCSAFTGIIPNSMRYVVPVTFVAIYGIVMGILGAVVRFLNLIDKIPIAKQLNRLAGIAAGVLRGVIAVWIIFCIAGYFANTSWGAGIYDMFESSKFLTMINTYNPLMRLVGQWRAVFGAVNM